MLAVVLKFQSSRVLAGEYIWHRSMALFSPSLVAAVIPLLGIWWQASRKEAGKEDELLGLSDGQRLMSAFRNKNQ